MFMRSDEILEVKIVITATVDVIKFESLET